MTRVRFYRGRCGRVTGFSVIGHAGQAPAGEDIVCAGISAVAISAVNALESVAGIKASLHIGEGFLSVRRPKNLPPLKAHDARVILRTARRGLIDMAATYPQYMRVT